MNPRDARHTTTTGAAIARGGSGVAAASAPAQVGWSLPVGVTPLALGLLGAIGLLVYLDRRVVFKK
jgi:hypothetical protein